MPNLWPMRRRSQESANDPEYNVEVPADIQAKLDAANGLQAKLDELSAAREADKELIAKMNGDFAELNAKLTSISMPPPNTTQAPQPPDFLSDPDAYMNYKMGPLVQVTLQQAARQELDIFSRSCADWKFFGNEATDMIHKGNLQQQADPIFIKNCYLIIKGNHADEIAKGKYNVVENGVGSGASANGEVNKNKNEFAATEEQLAFAARYGISPEEVKKVGGSLRFTA